MTLAGEEAPLLNGTKPGIPPAPFIQALQRPDGSRLPQAIAHRGDKSKFPENTLAAFRSAVELGVHAVETDLHLTKDKVVVLSHDASLQRCFGIDKKIADCDWAYLQTLRTARAPHEPLPRLGDLLAYLARPENESIWVLLDIKRDDDKEELLRYTAETLAAAPAPRPWRERVILGCWSAAYMEICQRRLEGYPITYIGFSVLWARSFLQVPNINFNILQKVLVGPLGRRFIRDARKAGRSLLVWTVNEEEWMEWSIRKAVDGVITDDPKKFLDVCARHEAATGSGKGSVEGAAHRPTLEAKRRAVRRWAELYLDIIKFNVLTIIMTGVFIYHLGWPSTQVRKSLLANHAVRQAS